MFAPDELITLAQAAGLIPGPLGPSPEHARPVVVPPFELETAGLEKFAHFHQEVERHIVGDAKRRFDAAN